MRLLPDTHVVLWWFDEPERLSARARTLLEDDDNPILFSAAVVWEAAIKQALGKLDSLADYDLLLDEGGATPLPINSAHAQAAAALPLHHRDPFDRILVAQAQIEGAVLLTADPAMRAYDVRIEW
ncbi:MAG TPA: type II toxin-antitoxin system VapC family toxin [Baekduia sp.]